MPPDDSVLHVPRARFHVALPEFGPAAELGRSTSVFQTSTASRERRAAQLGLDDLDAIEDIERASYPTPWSRSMFAGELAKPSSISLGAYDQGGALVGYLIISRYVDAWHVMNVPSRPPTGAGGLRPRCSSGCSS